MTLHYSFILGNNPASGTALSLGGVFGPFATPVGAQHATHLNPDVEYLRQGTYSAPAPVTLTAANSASSLLALPGEARQ